VRKNFAAALLVAALVPAGSIHGRETIVRPDINGKPTTLPVARTFNECVAGGIKLGYPRVGPGGESDRRGAVGFCRSRGFSP
jgi:hypothetical protein